MTVSASDKREKKGGRAKEEGDSEKTMVEHNSTKLTI